MRQSPPCNVREVPLSELAYFQTGGLSLGILEPANLAELASVMRWLYGLQNTHKPACHYFVLGGGTNSLISDAFYEGYVLSLARMDQLDISSQDSVVAGAGVLNKDVAEYAALHDLSGMEWMYGLPGQMGATTRMNARCYGSEISQVVRKVVTVSAAGHICEHDSSLSAMFRGYKDTKFMISGEIIAEVSLGLSRVLDPGCKETIYATMNSYKNDRKQKGQYSYPSCGCVFKNDYSESVGVAAGFLLDRAGAKSLVRGVGKGKVWVSSGHANFLFHCGEAKSEDILLLSLAMRELVYSYCGVWLDYEMEFLGDFPEDLWSRVIEHRPLDTAQAKQKALRSAQQAFQNRMQLARKENILPRT